MSMRCTKDVKIAHTQISFRQTRKRTCYSGKHSFCSITQFYWCESLIFYADQNVKMEPLCYMASTDMAWRYYLYLCVIFLFKLSCTIIQQNLSNPKKRSEIVHKFNKKKIFFKIRCSHKNIAYFTYLWWITYTMKAIKRFLNILTIIKHTVNV